MFPQWGLMERVVLSLRANGLFIRMSEFPVKEPSNEIRGEKHMVPVHGDTNSSFIHSYLSESPVRETSNEILGGKIRSPSTESLIDERPGSPRRSFKTLLLLHQCHAAFSIISSTLDWVDHSPINQHVS